VSNSRSSDVRYFTGLDLGQAQEFTALAVHECTRTWDSRDDEAVHSYAVRHLERFLLGTPYAAIAGRVAGLFDSSPLRDSTLALDATAVGKPVIDLFRADVRAHLVPVTVTGGHQALRDGKGGWLVPKKELVSALQILLQDRRLQVAPTLPEADTLARELSTFQIKVSLAADDALLDWRQRPHDDLVLAVAVAAWLGERQYKRPWRAEWF
jgi:hypothetical protein